MHEMTREEKRAAIRELCLVEMTGYPNIPMRELQRRMHESATFYVPLGMTRQVHAEIVKAIENPKCPHCGIDCLISGCDHPAQCQYCEAERKYSYGN